MKNNFFKSLEGLTIGETVDFEEALTHIAFNEQGLIPAIAQQHDTGEVLMLAWMNQDALLETLKTGRVCYWSRSRQTLWRKGESSGNQQQLVALRLDCDGDTVLCLVNQSGPACHTDRSNCFYWAVADNKLTMLTEPVDAT